MGCVFPNFLPSWNKTQATTGLYSSIKIIRFEIQKGTGPSSSMTHKVDGLGEVNMMIMMSITCCLVGKTRRYTNIRILEFKNADGSLTKGGAGQLRSLVPKSGDVG